MNIADLVCIGFLALVAIGIAVAVVEIRNTPLIDEVEDDEE